MSEVLAYSNRKGVEDFSEQSNSKKTSVKRGEAKRSWFGVVFPDHVRGNKQGETGKVGHCVSVAGV